MNVLRKVKNLQGIHMGIYGEYAGNGNIANFPELMMFDLPKLQYFDDVSISKDPLNVCTIYRNDGSYHLHISEMGKISCTVDDGHKKICKKLGFK